MKTESQLSEHAVRKFAYLLDAAGLVASQKRLKGAMEREDVMARAYRNDYQNTDLRASLKGNEAKSQINLACACCAFRENCAIFQGKVSESPGVSPAVQMHNYLLDPTTRDSFRAHIKLAIKKGKDITCFVAMRKGRLPAEIWR